MEDQSPAPAPVRAQKASSLGIPIAIVIAAGLISAAIYFSGNTAAPIALNNGTAEDTEQVTPERVIAPLTADDHIRGNPNAPIVLIEYSDYDCPFCKRFHEESMIPIIEEYGPSGKVAWVYRHLPLESLHPNAPAIALASECVAAEGGNEAFWTFSDLVFGERSVNELTDPARLPEFAQTAGVNVEAFNTCMQNGTYKDKVVASIDEAVAANGGPQNLGTPFTLVLVGGEFVGAISGAQPYNVVKQNIDGLIEQIEGGGGSS